MTFSERYQKKLILFRKQNARRQACLTVKAEKIISWSEAQHFRQLLQQAQVSPGQTALLLWERFGKRVVDQLTVREVEMLTRMLECRIKERTAA